MALNKQLKSWINDQASLSGSDIEDEDELEDGVDAYESMEGEDEELPNEDEIRAGIMKAHRELEAADNEKHLNRLKDLFDPEFVPPARMDFSYQSSLREDKIDYKALLGDPLGEDDYKSDEDEKDEILSFKDHLAKQQLQILQQQNRVNFTLAAFADDMSQGSIEDEEPVVSKNFTHNPNGISKFMFEKYHF